MLLNLIRKLPVLVLVIIAAVIIGNVKANAQGDLFKYCNDFPNSDVCQQKEQEQNNSKIGGAKGIFVRIINIIVYITATVSVLMVILGAFKYVTSGGEASQTKSAKDTIMYALIGLFVSINAGVVIRFILSKIS